MLRAQPRCDTHPRARVRLVESREHPGKTLQVCDDCEKAREAFFAPWFR